jgi:hypothetical protein
MADVLRRKPPNDSDDEAPKSSEHAKNEQSSEGYVTLVARKSGKARNSTGGKSTWTIASRHSQDRDQSDKSLTDIGTVRSSVCISPTKSHRKTWHNQLLSQYYEDGKIFYAVTRMFASDAFNLQLVSSLHSLYEVASYSAAHLYDAGYRRRRSP